MTSPDLSLYRIVHRAIRTATTDLADAAAAIDSADQSRRDAYARYWKGYAGEVLHHHTVEDEILFPALDARIPVAVEMTLRTDIEHVHLDQLMTAIDTSVAEIRAGRRAPDLADLTRELDRHMADHLDFEDGNILPLFERHFTKEEYDRMDQAAVKSAGLGPQAAFSVPMIVRAMTSEERATVLPGTPAALRLLHRLTRGSHARLVERAFEKQLVGVG
jgi:hemerythrin-like domain-containing protein